MIERFYFTSNAACPTLSCTEMSDGNRGLWDPGKERDACGVGLVVDRRGGRDRGVPPLEEECARRGEKLPEPGLFATGLFFLPRREGERRSCLQTVSRVLSSRGLPVLFWRKPPLRERALGEKARGSCPAIAQLFVGRPDGLSGEQFEGRLYLARKEMERRLRPLVPDRFYVVSLSHRTLVYKGLVRGVDLAAFYSDLENPLYETPFALFHQRYSTNTSPSWALAQPFRLLAHNGEINTIAGNRARMRAREASFAAGRRRRRGLRQRGAM